MLSNSIAENLKKVQDRIDGAARRVGRSVEEITLIAVSKTQGVDKIRSAFEAGAKAFGENYIQESKEKIPALSLPAEWHFIGHLQKNKVKDAVSLFNLIHTVDSLELAQLINQRAQQLGKVQRILIQVKVSEEETKSGAEEEIVPDLVKMVKGMPYLEIEGLMAMPPFFPDPDKVRSYFVRVHKLGEDLGLKDLSMGMSHDFEVAIEEGATMVRVGSAIFGARE